MTRVIRELLPTKELGFGLYFCDSMILSEYADGKWSEATLRPAGEFTLSPAAKTLHYAQEIFEGLKAFRTPSGEVQLFRPQANVTRMTRSAELMAMPPFPEDLFMRMILDIVKKYTHMIPELPGSLYLRPTMIGTGTSLGVAPSASYAFYILACPVGGYFGDVVTEKPASVPVYISQKYTRAAPGGIGAAKTGGNYAASLRAIAEAKAQGFSNVLFLDAKERRYLEELGGMNVFVVTKDGAIKTPPLGDTILAGVTRDSILKIAPTLGIRASETPISLDELLSGLRDGTVTELFACGTAASVTSIRELGIDNERIQVGSGESGPVATKLFLELTQIQSGKKTSAKFADWCVKVD
ncbi:MAG TPA: branched-chain amino acid aminotransferase [Bdellovibrionota bacterium]|jgi:branched-chain amino acid aminotransferase|nr:branched-chain amino acid aminotransferase [Bdellovibrionota bacterium]